MLLRAGEFEWTFPRPALVMGVLNVTPDSFSDGGQFFSVDAAVARALELIAQGADILDIGGESSRPGAALVSEAEELRRVIPVLEKLAGTIKIPLSIDTMKAGVARRALDAGASIVNDVAANRQETAMWEMVAERKAGYVLMHMQGTPQTMQSNPRYANVVEEVGNFFAERLNALSANGVERERVIFDVGIGFGKTVEHNLKLLGSLKSFTKWERPLLLGASRKRFIGQVTEVEKVTERLPGSLACACWGVAAGANIIRTHDVAETRRAIRMTEALCSQAGN
jgi:dihydropteroate synthase